MRNKQERPIMQTKVEKRGGRGKCHTDTKQQIDRLTDRNAEKNKQKSIVY